MIFYQFRVEREQELQRRRNARKDDTVVRSMKLGGGRNIRGFERPHRRRKN